MRGKSSVRAEQRLLTQQKQRSQRAALRPRRKFFARACRGATERSGVSRGGRVAENFKLKSFGKSNPNAAQQSNARKEQRLLTQQGNARKEQRLLTRQKQRLQRATLSHAAKATFAKSNAPTTQENFSQDAVKAQRNEVERSFYSGLAPTCSARCEKFF